MTGDKAWAATQPMIIMERYRFERTEHGSSTAEEWLHNARLQDLVHHGVQAFRAAA